MIQKQKTSEAGTDSWAASTEDLIRDLKEKLAKRDEVIALQNQMIYRLHEMLDEYKEQCMMLKNTLLQ